MYRALQALGAFVPAEDGLDLTASGAQLIRSLGVDPDTLPPSRAPMCRECLDWSMRQSHLAGRIGRALLVRFEEIGWARRLPGTRVIAFSPAGDRAFDAAFPLPA